MATNELDGEFIEFATKLVSTYGIDMLSSRIFAILYLEPGELSMEELSERTGYSIPSIFNSMKKLEATRFLKEIHRPGTKKRYFTLEKDFTKHMATMVDHIRKTKIGPAKEKLPAIIEKYRKEIRKNDEVSMSKLNIIENYYKQVNRMEKIINYIETQI